MTNEQVAANEPARGLDLPACEVDGTFVPAGRQFCPQHPHRPLASRRLSGGGVLYSFTVNHVAMSPTVSELTPYAVVLVETDDGPRVLAHASPALELRIGTRVRLVERPAADVSLYPGAGFRVAEPEGR